MKITRTRDFVINLGNYESFRTSCSVEVEATNLTAANLLAEEYLDAALKNDLLEAASLSDVRNTYVLTWNKEHYEGEK